MHKHFDYLTKEFLKRFASRKANNEGMIGKLIKTDTVSNRLSPWKGEK